MKILSAKAHGILDYLLVIFLLASPTLFKMEGHLAMFTYALGGVHLLLTILTAFPLGIIKVIPFRIHGLIELVVAIALGAVALWLREHGNTLGFEFYIGLTTLILVVFLVTDFRSNS